MERICGNDRFLACSEGVIDGSSGDDDRTGVCGMDRMHRKTQA